MKRSVVVGILGGVASGKSEVTRRLEARGAHVIHADTIGHEVLREPDIRDRLIQHFGNEILSKETGEIDRVRVAQLVFGNAPPQPRTGVSWKASCIRASEPESQSDSNRSNNRFLRTSHPRLWCSMCLS